VDKTIKGKEREDSISYPRLGVAAQEARPGQMETSETAEPQHGIQVTIPDSNPAKPHASDRKRPPRNRNLLDSVHAHLTLAPRENRIRIQPKHATSIFHDSGTLSLDRRLSEPHGNAVQSSMLVSGSLHENPTSADDPKPAKAMSAPDIMARTRARHARCSVMPSTSAIQPHGIDSSYFPSNNRENGLQSHPASNGQVNGTRRGGPTTQDHVSEGTGRTGLRISQAFDTCQARQQSPQPTPGLSSGALPPHYHVPTSNSMDGILLNDTISHHPSMSPLTMRDRLLARLEEEKICARGAEPMVALANPQIMSALDTDRTFPGSADRLSVNPCSLTDPNIVDTQSMEARLRTRAQLRIRLSAEKKSGGS
jgi:hypothetical protein